MKPILTPEQSRAFDRTLIEEHGIGGLDLMECAAKGVADIVRSRFHQKDRILILCGCGNNGGDGFAILRLLHDAGYPVDGLLWNNPCALRSDALENYRRALRSGCCFLTALPELDPYACIVDALFGTGLSRDIDQETCRLIEQVNQSTAWRIAVDIPSGIDGLTGRVCGAAILAQETVTFQAVKPGLLLPPGRVHAGAIRVHPLSEHALPSVEQYWLEESDVAGLLPPRPIDSHKGKNGRALLCAGSERYTGAALLSARAALRGGAGLLMVAVPSAIKPAFAQIPEAMAIPCGIGGDWDLIAQQDAIRQIGNSSAIGIGCGMGRMEDAALLCSVLASRLPTVIDADAINLLASQPELRSLLHENVVITPHPAEMARFLQCDTASVLADPIRIARETSERFHCVVLLKGATTCISDGRAVYLNTSGNPGLAKGGSGDVLTGLLLALLAQNLSPINAACAAAYLLGASADRAYTILGNRMLVAGDVIDAINQEIHAERAR